MSNEQKNEVNMCTRVEETKPFSKRVKCDLRKNAYQNVIL